MGSSRVLIVLVCLIMASSHQVSAQNKPKDYVNAHNKARAEVGVPPLVWNTTLAAYAKSYVRIRSKDCLMQHSQTEYGENLAAGSWDVTAKESVGMWLEEESLYDEKTNTCRKSPEACLHYTQVVWRSTAQVGCARARCPDGWTFVSCNYYPPGNYVGERPY